MKWVIISLLAWPQESEEECKKAIEAFRAACRNAAEPARVTAIDDLGRHRCEAAIGILAPLLTAETEGVRAGAAKALGKYDHPKAVEVVAFAVSPNAQRRSVLEALAKALEDLDWELGAQYLNPLLSKHHDKDVLDTFDVIVPVLGKMGSATSVEPLIKLLEHAESEGKRTRALGRRIAGNKDMAALEAPIRKALQEITGGSEPTADKWDEWWKRNREGLFAKAQVTYRCRSTGKRWTQKAGEPQECPQHEKPEKDGQVVKTRLRR